MLKQRCKCGPIHKYNGRVFTCRANVHRTSDIDTTLHKHFPKSDDEGNLLYSSNKGVHMMLLDDWPGYMLLYVLCMPIFILIKPIPISIHVLR